MTKTVILVCTCNQFTKLNAYKSKAGNVKHNPYLLTAQKHYQENKNQLKINKQLILHAA